MADEFDQYKRQAPQTGDDEFAQYKRAAQPDPTLLTSATGPYSTANAPTTTEKMFSGAKDVGVGALKGLGHTAMEVHGLINKIPHVGGEPQSLSDLVDPGRKERNAKATAALLTPKNAAQKVGFQGEQIGEWLVPTGLEEKLGIKAAKMLPWLGKAAAPIGRIVAGSLESGVRNKTQGGEFGTGAVMGGGTGVLGEAGRAVAPKLAESALGISKRLRGFGRTPGKAALSEIKGIRPSTIAANAGGKLGQLTSELENAAAQPRYTLAGGPGAPVNEVLMKVDPARLDAAWPRDSFYVGKGGAGVGGPGASSAMPSRYTGFDQWLKDNPGVPIEAPRVGMDKSGNVGFTNGRHRFAVLRDQGVPEVQVSVEPSQVGAFEKKFGASRVQTPPASAAGPATTQPAIDLLNDKMQQAAKQNNKTLYNALKDVHEQLTKDFQSGQALPSRMSPSQILDLKRGIGDLEGNWNPELRGKLKGIVRQVYSALDKELDRTVPGADKLNQRISSLIPVKKRAESIGRGANMSQRLMHRVGAHTGALIGASTGGAYGYREGGVPGAILGGISGLVVPEVMASPTAQMAAARALRSPKTLRLGRGTTSQFMRRGNE